MISPASELGRRIRPSQVFVMPAFLDRHLGHIEMSGPPVVRDDWTFEINGLRGAIAVGYLEPGDERDPDVLAQWRRRGTLFALSEGETHALDLSLSASAF